MNRVSCLAMLVLVMSASTGLSGVFKTGNDLLELIELSLNLEDPTHWQAESMVQGYIAGVHDTNYDTPLGNRLCFPEDVTVGMMRKLIHQYLLGNPDKLDEGADWLIYKALIQQWPCQKP